VPVLTYCTKFGTFGNECHLPSGEMAALRIGFSGFVSALVSAFDVVISTNILRDTKSGYNSKIEVNKTSYYHLFSM
jgi:hypothetical protein